MREKAIRPPVARLLKACRPAAISWLISLATFFAFSASVATGVVDPVDGMIQANDCPQSESLSRQIDEFGVFDRIEVSHECISGKGAFVVRASVM